MPQRSCCSSGWSSACMPRTRQTLTSRFITARNKQTPSEDCDHCLIKPQRVSLLRCWVTLFLPKPSKPSLQSVSIDCCLIDGDVAADVDVDPAAGTDARVNTERRRLCAPCGCLLTLLVTPFMKSVFLWFTPPMQTVNEANRRGRQHCNFS